MGLDVQAFLLGVSLTLWGVTVSGLGYAVWRYVYTPWKVLRGDVRMLNEKIDGVSLRITNELGLRRVLSMDEEDAARAENRLLARRRAAATSLPERLRDA